MPPPPPPSKSYLLVLDTDTEDEEDNDNYEFNLANFMKEEQAYTERVIVEKKSDNDIKHERVPCSFDQSDCASMTQKIVAMEENSKTIDCSSEVEDINKKEIKNKKKKKKKKKKNRKKNIQKDTSEKLNDDVEKLGLEENNGESILDINIKTGKKEKSGFVVRFGEVSVRKYHRCLGCDVVPFDGGWPLGLSNRIMEYSTYAEDRVIDETNHQDDEGNDQEQEHVEKQNISHGNDNETEKENEKDDLDRSTMEVATYEKRKQERLRRRYCEYVVKRRIEELEKEMVLQRRRRKKHHKHRKGRNRANSCEIENKGDGKEICSNIEDEKKRIALVPVYIPTGYTFETRQLDFKRTGTVPVKGDYCKHSIGESAATMTNATQREWKEVHASTSLIGNNVLFRPLDEHERRSIILRDNFEKEEDDDDDDDDGNDNKGNKCLVNENVNEYDSTTADVVGDKENGDNKEIKKHKNSGILGEGSSGKKKKNAKGTEMYSPENVRRVHKELDRLRVCRRDRGTKGIGCACRRPLIPPLPEDRRGRWTEKRVRDELNKLGIDPNESINNDIISGNDVNDDDEQEYSSNYFLRKNLENDRNCNINNAQNGGRRKKTKKKNSPARSREILEMILREELGRRGCCDGITNCPCHSNGIGCQADTCGCWENEGRDKSNDDNSGSSEIERIKHNCGNRNGMYVADFDKIREHRTRFISSKEGGICVPILS